MPVVLVRAIRLHGSIRIMAGIGKIWTVACLGLVLALGMTHVAVADAPDSPTSSRAVEDPRVLEGEDTYGKSVRPFSEKAAAYVFIFLSNDCPIANRYAPEIRRIIGAFAKSGVKFWLVHPLTDETGESIRQHAKEYDLPGPFLRDPKRVLTQFSGATVTPEAVVFDGDLRRIYRGRIDDRYPQLGRQRAEPTSRDLRDALEAVISGRAVSEQRTRAIGCSIPDLE